MSANSPDTDIPFTKKESEKIDNIRNLVLSYERPMRNLNGRLDKLYDLIEKVEDRMDSVVGANNEETDKLHEETDKLRKDVERLFKMNNLNNSNNDVDDEALGEFKPESAGKKRRRKTKSNPTQKCKQYLRNKIKKTMREYKKKTKGIKNRKQALAIAYSQTKKKHPKCKF